jgi:hypothetical protein
MPSRRSRRGKCIQCFLTCLEGLHEAGIQAPDLLQVSSQPSFDGDGNSHPRQHRSLIKPQWQHEGLDGRGYMLIECVNSTGSSTPRPTFLLLLSSKFFAASGA